VAISCVDGATFHLWGFINAAISNLCFSSRAVITKRLFSNYPGAMDEYQLFSHISRVGLIILVPTTLLLEGSKIRELVYDDIGSLSILIQLLLLNGVAYTSYNLLSFLVLSRTDLVTHAVFNVFRRVVIIVTTTWYFNTSLSILNIGGVSLAVFGVLLFVIAKRREMSSSMNEINGLSK
jgi:solute carrier family 35 protein E1